MGKFNYLDERYTKNSIPLKDDIWFEVHQRLLLRIVNTDYGRDLLHIKKDFPTIDMIGKSFVRGIIGYKDNNPVYKSRFRVGAPYANIIRTRWKEFYSYAKLFYDKSHLQMTEVNWKGRSMLAAAVDTSFPNPSPESVTFDASCYKLENVSTQWANLHDATDATALRSTSISQMWVFLRSAPSFIWNQDERAFMLFETVNIGEGMTLLSGTIEMKADIEYQTGDLTSWLQEFAFVTTTPASDIDIAFGDYDQYGTTKLVDTNLDVDSMTAGNSYVSELNSDGLAAVNPIGITKLGIITEHTRTDVEPWNKAMDQFFGYAFTTADAGGTGDDPTLEITYSAAQPNLNGTLLSRGAHNGHPIRTFDF